MNSRHRHLVRLHPREDLFYLSQGRTVMSTGLDGHIHEGTSQGLFVHETRMLSKYRWLVDGQAPLPVALSNVEQHSWLGYYVAVRPEDRPAERDPGSGETEPYSEDTVELRISRFVGGGMHEDVDITNYTRGPVELRLELEVDADFIDQEETYRGRVQHGECVREWRNDGEGGELAFDYHARHEYDQQGHKGIATVHRGIAIRFRRSSTPAKQDEKIAFRIRLERGESWHTCVEVTPHLESEKLPPQYGCRAFDPTENFFDQRRRVFLEEATEFSTRESPTLAPVVGRALEQAKMDLLALRLYDLDHGERAWTMAAGLPIFVALFGRDVLTASWEAAMVSPQMMHGSLLELKRWQGTKIDDWRDEEPGKMLHEAHTGPLEALNYFPRRRYYGAATTSSFYPVVLSELWHWTGDRALVEPLLEPALKALDWVDRYTDYNGDGFYEYQTRSMYGTYYQGWKDSQTAIVYPDGRPVPTPVGTCEEQAFVYVAKLHMAELLWWLDRKDLAKRFYQEAAELKKRFNEAFWLEDQGYFAMGLDAQGRPIATVGSDAGHCLAAGIADESLVERVARRMLQPDLFSGWGVRTLSREHPAYNPYSYHRGSVWPVEHGTFALGFVRYGLHEAVERVCRAQFETARLFDHCRLPEVFSGHARDADHPFPAIYPKANWPQAWSSSAIFAMVQAMLGLYPYAPLNLLLLDPHLPEWLPELTLRNLHVGEAVVDIRFFRGAAGSDYEVLEKRGTLHVLRQPSPWSLTAGFGERLKDALQSLLPGRRKAS